MEDDFADHRVPVAEYVRMSTDHQRYSIDNQRAALADYAAAKSMKIVRSYSDEGRSGLTIRLRSGLQALLREVDEPARPFNVILVYDISRWGRFQDADESAYYEHILRRAGVSVIYCAEPFENDGSPILRDCEERQASNGGWPSAPQVFASVRPPRSRGHRRAFAVTSQVGGPARDRTQEE